MGADEPSQLPGSEGDARPAPRGLRGRLEIVPAESAWQQRLAAINAYLQEQFNRQIQSGYDQIAAAARLSQQISANNDAMIAAIDRQLAASSAGNTGSASGRSSVEKFDDYIRGVETADDPYYGTSQQSADYQYHWTDGYDGYRNTNDPSYRPGQTESGDWTLMTAAR